MKRMRMTLLLFAVGVAGMVLVSPCGAADVAADPATAASDSVSAAECPKCTCSCSPWLGAWVGCFSQGAKNDGAVVLDSVTDRVYKCDEKIIETIKLSMKDLSCDQFVVNLQASLCEEKVRRAFPETDRVTEFVGVGCKNDYNQLTFTAIGYGMKTHDKICDEVVFIAIKSGTITCPRNPDPNVVDVAETIEIFAAEQDTDCDGLPDDCDSVLCLSREGKLKRILNKPPCKPARSFLALLEPCIDVQTEAQGKAFFKQEEYAEELSFVVTVKNIKDVQRVAIHVLEQVYVRELEHQDKDEAVVLCPIAPETECKSGEFSGVLCCGTIREKDCKGPLKSNKKIEELIKAITEGRAVVIIQTKEYPRGELCGRVEDP